MAKIWRKRIIACTRTYDEVPLTWKAAVKALLIQDVIDGTMMGDGSIFDAEKYEEIVGEPFPEPNEE